MSRVVSGAKAKFSIMTKKNGLVLVAYASNCSYNWNHNHQPIELLGKPEVDEHTELGMTVDFTCTTFRVFEKSAVSLGFQPYLKDLLVQDELVVTILDDQNRNLLSVSGVKLTGRSGTVDARGVWTETLSFVGRLVHDEAGPSAV